MFHFTLQLHAMLKSGESALQLLLRAYVNFKAALVLASSETACCCHMRTLTFLSPLLPS
jgi:hypothetical protein